MIDLSLDLKVTISVFGDVDLLEVPQGVLVSNDGSGKVTVNGKNIATGEFLETPYSILNGADQIWDGTGKLIIEANGIYTKLDNVTVDNKTLTEGIDYNLSDGSTIATFTYTYLDDLSNGTYEVILTWSDGWSVSTTFTVKKALVWTPKFPQILQIHLNVRKSLVKTMYILMKTMLVSSNT